MNKCKICGGTLKKIQKIYCSNKCKFSDKEYNHSRGIKHKQNPNNKIATCKYCNKVFKDIYNLSGILYKHLKNEHNINLTSINKHYIIINYIDNKKKVKCPLCNWSTFDTTNRSGWFTSHITKKHNLDIYKFIEKYSSYRPLFLKQINILKRYTFLEQENNFIQCEICKKKYKKISNTHLKNKHNITPAEYKQKYNVYKTTSEATSLLQSNSTLDYNFNNGSAFHKHPSDLESAFADELTKLGILFIEQFLYKGKRFDFYLPLQNTVIEIDGETHHKNELKKLTIQTMNTSINDYQKDNIMKTSEKNFIFYRIRYNKEIFNTKTEFFEKLKQLKYTRDYSIQYKQKIIIKEYFENYHKYSKTHIEKYIPLLIKFIRTFQAEFPYPTCDDKIDDIIYKLQKTKIENIYDKYTKTFKAICCSSLGVSYLKSTFKSYWHVNYKNNLSPYEAFFDDNIMYKLLKYRIGCNNSNETFDFSLYQILRGLSAMRYTVSFFKPSLAYSIYKIFLKDNKKPTVLDPSAGFGGRMLGFVSAYPNGTYIGVEPDTKRYKELFNLAKKFNNVILYNCKFEDLDTAKLKYDLLFTSIPYFDKENYINYYKDKNEWISTYINKIKSSSNCVINVDENNKGLFNGDDYKIQYNTSHYNTTKTSKIEYLIKF